MTIGQCCSVASAIALLVAACAEQTLVPGEPKAAKLDIAPYAMHEDCANCHHLGVASSASSGDSSATTTVPCRDCHAGLESRQVLDAGFVTHRKLACVACHEPHANGVPFHFRRDRIASSAASDNFDPETRLCVSCHFEPGQFRVMGGGFIRHPIGVRVRQHDRHIVKVRA